MNKIAFITGITGQDGKYLSEFLLGKGYIIHGLIRRSSSLNTSRIDHLYKDPHLENVKFFLHYGDMCDLVSISELFEKIKPDEVYNLAAMSHVKISFEIPEYTSDVNGIGTLRLLEIIKKCEQNTNKKIKFYNATTSEMFGGGENLNENSPFVPKSPYSVSKLYSYWISNVYKESYGLFCCNGILFNHTSPYRGHNFIEQKIVKGAVKIYKEIGRKIEKEFLFQPIYLGNLYSKRDIGHCKDYVKAMWMMLQQDEPDNYVISTGISFSVKEITNFVFEILNLNLEWKGSGLDEIGYIQLEKEKEDSSFSFFPVVKIDSKYFRPNEVHNLTGDSSKARKVLGWSHEYNIHNILVEMINFELIYQN
jgi:GDPmannose 4,6-dehydratase